MATSELALQPHLCALLIKLFLRWQRARAKRFEPLEGRSTCHPPRTFSRRAAAALCAPRVEPRRCPRPPPASRLEPEMAAPRESALGPGAAAFCRRLLILIRATRAPAIGCQPVCPSPPATAQIAPPTRLQSAQMRQTKANGFPSPSLKCRFGSRGQTHDHYPAMLMDRARTNPCWWQSRGRAITGLSRPRLETDTATRLLADRGVVT